MIFVRRAVKELIVE